MIDEFIGSKIETAEGSILTVTGRTNRKQGSQWFYELTCSVCSNDSVMYPDPFESTKDRLKRGCPCGCAISKKISRYQWMVRVDRESAAKGYEFVGIRGEFNGNMSRVILNCHEHGSFEIRIANLLERRRPRGCPSCATRGFKSSVDAWVYLLHSVDGSICKVGISNNVDSRLGDLRRATPFQFIKKAEIKTSGKNARALERSCHERFMSAELSGFDGCTEWLMRDEEIDKMFS